MRKDLLANSLKAVRAGNKSGPEASAGKETSKPNVLSTVLDVKRGLDHLNSGAAQLVDPDQISESAIQDRFDLQEGLEEIVESIRNSGQQIPVLLRQTSNGPKPFEVVYGRRRIEACRQLGIEVKAYINNLDDREALISQGLENAARLQRSFIEQAVYAQKLIDHGLARTDVMQILAVNQSSLSRMLTVTSIIPATVIAAIGSAHDVGRRQWLKLRDIFASQDDLSEEGVLRMIDHDLGSSQRLLALIKTLSKAPSPTPNTRQREIAGGLVKVRRARNQLTIRWTRDEIAGFADYLDDNIEQLLVDFRSKHEPPVIEVDNED